MSTVLKHILHIKDTKSNLSAGSTRLKNGQDGYTTDTKELVYMDDVGIFHVVNAIGSSIDILSSAPATVAGTIVPWMLDTEYAAGDYKIRVVFPDGTDRGVYLPFSYL